eukprot:4783623-Prymnesium_polylepis.1
MKPPGGATPFLASSLEPRRQARGYLGVCSRRAAAATLCGGAHRWRCRRCIWAAPRRAAPRLSLSRRSVGRSVGPPIDTRVRARSECGRYVRATPLRHCSAAPRAAT